MNQLSPKSVSLKSLNNIKVRHSMDNEPTTKPIEDEEWLRPLTMEEIDAMLDEAEANFAAGLGIPGEVVFRELEEEYAKEDAESQLETI